MSPPGRSWATGRRASFNWPVRSRAAITVAWPGLGVNQVLSIGGDAFYFPLNADPEVTAAQRRLASLVVSCDVQLAFNRKKGSLPVRGDIDATTANACTLKALEILKSGAILPDGTMVLTPETSGRIDDLMVAFWNTPAMTADRAAGEIRGHHRGGGLRLSLVRG